MPRARHAADVRAGGRILRTAAVSFFASIASARLRMLADPYVDADDRKKKSPLRGRILKRASMFRQGKHPKEY